MSLELEWKDKSEFGVALNDKVMPLKSLIIKYVGEKLSPDNDDVTVGMVVGVLAEEFPEVVFSLAEENWVRGYEQGLEDIKALEE